MHSLVKTRGTDNKSQTLVAQRVTLLFVWIVLIAEAAAALYMFRPWQDGDTSRYIALAGSLADGHYGASINGIFSPEANRPPGYPLFLYVCLVLFRMPAVLVVSIQIGLYLLSIWVLTRLLEEWKLPTVPFLLLCAIYPFGLGYSAKLMTEGLATFLVTLAVYFSARPTLLSRWNTIVMGILLGFLILVRASFVALPIVFLGCMAYRYLRHHRLRTFLYRTITVLLVACTVVLPYSIYNWKHFQTFKPLPRAGGGLVLYVGSWENELTAADFQSFYDGKISDHARQSGFAAEVARIDAQFGLPALTPPYAAEVFGSADQEIRGVRLLRKEAIQRIRAHPWIYLRIAFLRCWKLWNISAYPASIPFSTRIGLEAVSAILWVLGFLGGIWLLVRRRSELTVAIVLPMLYFPAIHMWLATVGRYTAPARPLLVAIAAVVLVELYRSYGEYRASKTIQSINTEHLDDRVLADVIS